MKAPALADQLTYTENDNNATQWGKKGDNISFKATPTCNGFK